MTITAVITQRVEGMTLEDLIVVVEDADAEASWTPFEAACARELARREDS